MIYFAHYLVQILQKMITYYGYIRVICRAIEAFNKTKTKIVRLYWREQTATRERQKI